MKTKLVVILMIIGVLFGEELLAATGIPGLAPSILAERICISEGKVFAIPFKIQNTSNKTIFLLGSSREVVYIPEIYGKNVNVRYSIPSPKIIDGHIIYEIIYSNSSPLLFVLSPNQVFNGEIKVASGKLVNLNSGNYNLKIVFGFSNKRINTSQPINIFEFNRWASIIDSDSVSLVIE